MSVRIIWPRGFDVMYYYKTPFETGVTSSMHIALRKISAVDKFRQLFRNQRIALTIMDAYATTEDCSHYPVYRSGSIAMASFIYRFRLGLRLITMIEEHEYFCLREIGYLNRDYFTLAPSFALYLYDGSYLNRVCVRKQIRVMDQFFNYDALTAHDFDFIIPMFVYTFLLKYMHCCWHGLCIVRLSALMKLKNDRLRFLFSKATGINLFDDYACVPLSSLDVSDRPHLFKYRRNLMYNMVVVSQDQLETYANTRRANFYPYRGMVSRYNPINCDSGSDYYSSEYE